MVERHYCKFCNAWLQGDKISIKHHEQGRKHKEMVEETLKQKRRAKSDAFHSERDLQQQLKEIEEAAHARFAEDMTASGVPPPPPPRYSIQQRRNVATDGLSQRTTQHRVQQVEEEEEELLEPKEDDRGVYMIRGVVYLEGKKHEDKLETGSACQIWVEPIEEWLDALIEQVTVHTIPNTELSFRRFTITYMLPENPQPVKETGVLADRLRIQMPAGMTLETAERMIEQMQSNEIKSAEEAMQKQIVIDETTGMGEWSTVVVHEIDESEEAIAQREAEAQAEAEKLAEEQKRREALEDFSAQGDDALGAFNPWGGSYKGVQLEDEKAPKKAQEEDIMITTNGNVDFKKRRKTNGTDKKQKRIRLKSDDD